MTCRAAFPRRAMLSHLLHSPPCIRVDASAILSQHFHFKDPAS